MPALDPQAVLFVRHGTFGQGPPAVKYRGIFLKDEEPAFSGWAKEKFGGVNSKVYAHVFDLLLRLRGNYLWPGMWGKAFNEDDPADHPAARVADSSRTGGFAVGSGSPACIFQHLLSIHS